ncbi:ubiquitin-like-specific protease 1D isoform X3 [Salvia miltiorrhiza]|uniref:ubiquitin-like-specific protease 1D isoform X3 n=1 Tax=Salvia miltiorrhiza TaxID=226208 RepID=UPI0025AD59B6|nr:ubiquitin-like-specific protease 1D isoform X3 [Salvia miltiorrhiza]
MAEGGERKRKGGIELDFDTLLGRDDEPPPELLIQDAPAHAEEVDPMADIHLRKLSDKDLTERITRVRKFNASKLPDGGEKLRALNKKLEAEVARRNLEKDKKVITLADDSTGAMDDLSHPQAPPSKPTSEFAFQFCSKLDKERTNRSFQEELSTLNQSDHKKIREHKPFLAQITQKHGLSSRQTPFKSPNHLSANIGNQQQTNGEKRGIKASNSTSNLSDKDVSGRSTKKESGAHSLHQHNTRRNNRRSFVLVDEDEEELDVDVEDETDQVCQSSKDARIYYPSRDDPEAIEICYLDMECLAPESYLSSPIMNFYIRYLQKPTSPNAKRKHDYHMFNTYFYEKLKQDVLTKTERKALFLKFRRWWKGVNIFEKPYIFLPIHENRHWSLVIICIPNKQDESGPIILHLDSLRLHCSKSIFGNVKSFLKEEWEFLKQEEVLPELPISENIWNRLSRRIEEKVIEVPQQQNEYDCGLFVLFFMERFIDEAPERLKKQDLDMVLLHSNNVLHEGCIFLVFLIFVVHHTYSPSIIYYLLCALLFVISSEGNGSDLQKLRT